MSVNTTYTWQPKPNLKDLFSSSEKEEVVRSVVFEALSKWGYEELKLSCPTRYKRRLMGYNQARTQKITQAVEQLTALCDLKGDLESQSNYRATKFSFASITRIYCLFMHFNRRFPECGTQLGSKLQKYYSQCRESQRESILRKTPSLEPIWEALKDLSTTNDTKRLYDLLLFDFLEYASCRLDEIGHDGFLQRELERRRQKIRATLCDFDPTVLDIFDTQARDALTQALHIIKPCTEPAKDVHDRVLQNFTRVDFITLAGLYVNMRITDWQNTHHSYCREEKYAHYTQRRDMVSKIFAEISPYCSKTRLEHHPKMRNDARAKIEKYLVAQELLRTDVGNY